MLVPLLSMTFLPRVTHIVWLRTRGISSAHLGQSLYTDSRKQLVANLKKFSLELGEEGRIQKQSS